MKEIIEERLAQVRKQSETAKYLQERELRGEIRALEFVLGELAKFSNSPKRWTDTDKAILNGELP